MPEERSWDTTPLTKRQHPKPQYKKCKRQWDFIHWHFVRGIMTGYPKVLNYTYFRFFFFSNIDKLLLQILYVFSAFLFPMNKPQQIHVRGALLLRKCFCMTILASSYSMLQTIIIWDENILITESTPV